MDDKSLDPSLDSEQTADKAEAPSYTNKEAETSAAEEKLEIKSLGDQIYASLMHWRNFLFRVGEDLQLAYNAMDSQAGLIRAREEGAITINYPLGQRADGSTITGQKDYERDLLINEYVRIVGYSVPVTGVYDLVIAVEAAIEDATRAILKEYPKKLKADKKIQASAAFEAKTIDELRANTVADILNGLAYKSPKDLAETLEKVFSFPLLEIPQFHRYVEVKATRDIHMHNRGTANDTYRRKADTMARVEAGEWLPVTIEYFLESHECCLKLVEVLVERFDSVWPSDLYREYSANKASTEANK